MNTLFRYTNQIEFRSSLSISDCVNKLRSASADVTGSVSDNQVVLHRIQFFFGSLYKPYFYGRFSRDGGNTVLKGMFTISRFARISSSAALIAITILEIILLLSAFGPSDRWQIIILFVVIAIATGIGLGLILVVKRLSRKDIRQISSTIESALGR